MLNDEQFGFYMQQVLDNVPSAVVVTNNIGNVIYTNLFAKNSFNLYHSAGSESLIFNLLRAYDPDLEIINKIILEPTTKKIGVLINSNSKNAFIEYNIASFYNNNLQEQQFIFTINSINENSWLELKANKKQLELIYETVDDILFTIEVKNNIEFIFSSVNNAFCKSTGYTKAEVINANITDIIPKSSLNLVLLNYTKAIESKQTVKWEETSTFNNEEKTGLVTITPVFDEINNCIQLIGSIRDITERKKAELKLQLSNERFNFVTKALGAAIWDWDIENDRVYWGEGFFKIFGISEATEGKSFVQVLERCHVDDRFRIEKSLKLILQTTETTWSNSYRFLNNNGKFVQVQDKAIIIRNEAGKAIRMIGALSDITIRKAEEQQLKLYKSVITNTNDCVIIAEADLSNNGPKIIYVNESFTKMTGYTREEIIGKTPRVLQGPKTNRNVLDKLRKSLENQEICEVELINYKKNGEEYWVNLSIFPLIDAQGKCTHFVSIQRDTTERNKHSIEKETIFEIIQSINKNQNLSFSLNEVIENVCVFLGFHYGEIWSINIDETKMVHRATYRIDDSKFLGEINKGTNTLEKGQGLPGLSWKLKERIYIEDLQNSTFLRKADALKSKLSSGMALPIYFNNEVIAVFNLFSEKPFTKEQINSDLLNKLTTQIGAYIQKNRKDLELNQFFNMSADMLAISNLNGYFKKVNPAFTNILGYSEEEMLNKPLINFVHQDDRNLTLAELENVQNGKITTYLENRFIAKNGDVKWLSWTCAPLVEEALIFSVTKDITEKKKMDEELKNLIKELTNSNLELKQFSYITSHNMRSPLTNLLAILDILDLSKIDDSETLELLSAMKASTNHLNDTLNDLIRILIIKGNTNQTLEKIAFNDVLSNVSDSIGSLIKNSGTQILANFENIDSVYFNKTYLESIFLNLITNSIKYAQPKIKPLITIKSFIEDGKLKLSFSDNGIGFNEQKVKDKIFGLYQKFHNHEDSKGIGLYLVQSQINSLGGSIHVQSEINKGTTFTITFSKT